MAKMMGLLEHFACCPPYAASAHQHTQQWVVISPEVASLLAKPMDLCLGPVFARELN